MLWLQGGANTAKMHVTVNAAFETLVDHHVWGEERSMRTILRKKHNAEHLRNKPRTTQIAILLQFRAIDAHDPT